MGYVYMIQNLKNNKLYIGSTVNIKNRIMAHKRGLRGGYHDNHILQEEYDYYGEESFVYTLLCEEDDDDKRYSIEADIIQSLKTYENGYNLSMDGRGRYMLSDSTREKMRTSSIGENNPFYGKSHTNESKKIMSEYAKKRVGDKNPFYGKSHTKETLDKIAKSYSKLKESGWVNPQKGVPKSERAKLNNALAQPSRKSVHAEGNEFISISQCAKHLGVVNSTVRNRINSEKFPDYYYI